MKNTKKLVAIFVALVMVVACVFALVACDSHKCESKCPDCGKCLNKDCEEKACKDKCEGHGPSEEIPTEEGKVTLYWKVVNTVELTDITSYFLCGTPNSWTEGNTDYEFKRIGSSDVYYVYMDPTTATGAEYKVLIGYNSKSPVSEADQGPFWANESYGKTWSAGGGNSTVPEFTGNTVDCGTIEFDGCLGDPVPVSNFDVKVSFVKGQLNANSLVYILGGFTGWDHNMPNDTKIKAVKDTDTDNSSELDVYKIHVDAMYANEKAPYVVVVFVNGIDSITPVDGEGNTVEAEKATVWNYLETPNSGAIKICASNNQNATIAVTNMYEGNYMDIANTISTGSKARGLDLTKKVENKKDDQGLGYYNLDIITVLPPVQVTFKVEFTEALASDLIVYLAGENMEGLAWGDTTLKFTADAERKVFTLEVTAPLGVTINCKVVVCGTSWSWDHAYGNAEGGNLSIMIDSEGDIDLFESALTYAA